MAVMVADPGATPETVTLAVKLPSGIVNDEACNATAAGLSLSKVTSSPPAGAGVVIVKGSDAVPPKPTLSVVGRLRT